MIVTVNAILILGLFVPVWLSGYLTGKALKREKTQAEELPTSTKRRHDAKRDVSSWLTVASPVVGRVQVNNEGSANSVIIMPEEEKLYAPVSGKVVKLYPLGNVFVIQMEDKSELKISVGGYPDELCADYFCPRVIQNEIVNKGKLLLVFDKEQLFSAGEDVTVTVSLENSVNEKEVVLTQASHVKVGDELMRLCEKKS